MSSGIFSLPARHSVDRTEQRRIIDRIMEKGQYPEEKRSILRECYLQRNRMESAAEKLRMSFTETELWYTAFSLELALASMNRGRR